MKNKKLRVACIRVCFFTAVASFILFNISYAEKSPAAHEPIEHVNEPADHDHEAEQHVDDHAGHGLGPGEHMRDPEPEEHGDEHAGHEHGPDEHVNDSEPEEHGDEHAGHAHTAGTQVEAAGDHEGEIEVAPEAMKLAGITMAEAGIGRISTTVKLSGEVGFNEERFMRITPRFAGIIKQARFRKGEFVKAGEVLAVIESNESMAPYSLKAPLSGRIIEKQAVPGEYASEEKSIYVLADLSTVWVNLAVYPKDADKVKPGKKVSITVVGSDTSTIGTVYYVTPVIDAQTRTITACVVLPNADNAWRPGSFVHAQMEAGEGVEGLVVEKDAVQILDNKSVVFVQHEPGSFKPVEVVTGENDSRKILIVSGLEAGDEYVNNGAFELKAKIVTSSLGDHAGHGH